MALDSVWHGNQQLFLPGLERGPTDPFWGLAFVFKPVSMAALEPRYDPAGMAVARDGIWSESGKELRPWRRIPPA